MGANNEALKSIKRYQGQLREAECQYEEACRLRQEMSEKASLSDRRANALQGEVEEARALLDSAERGKRQTEAEPGDARNAVNEMNSINSEPDLTRDVLREPSTPCRLRLMTFCTRPRTPRRRPRRPWLMPPDLLMSSDLSRTMSLPSARVRELLRPSLENSRTVLLTPMRAPCVVASLPWPSWRLASVSSRLSLAMSRPAPERTCSLTR